MAFVDRLLLRGPEETARAEAMREFKRTMLRHGSFSEFAESGITSYYDHRFGRFEPALDVWKAEVHILKGNPQLRRVDVIADTVFGSGLFAVKSLGPITPRSDPGLIEGVAAAVALQDRPGRMIGMLTLDVGSEVRFTKLRIGVVGGNELVVRPSALDRGMAISPNKPGRRDLPETMSEKAPQGSIIVQTIGEAVAALERLLSGKSI